MDPSEVPELLEVEQLLLEVVSRLDPSDLDRAVLERARQSVAAVLDDAVCRSAAVIEAVQRIIDQET